jgi:hypothetical protein
MRTPIFALAIAAFGCGHAATAPLPAAASSAQQCGYEIVQPDASAAAKDFRAWLQPRAEKLFGDDDVSSGDVFVADLNNDGSNEFVFARHEGSGSYLAAWIFRRDAAGWSQVEGSPIDERLSGEHEYSGPLMKAPQLIARLCGKTIVNFMGGSEPNYYPESVMWEGSTAHAVCTAPWLMHHRAAAADLVKLNMLDEARVLLEGVKSCSGASPLDLRDINDDLSRITARTANASAVAYDFSWLITEVKKDPDQQLVLDPRFGDMLVAVIPDAQIDGESLRGALKKSVWVPGNSRVLDDRYVVIAGCEPHNCGNRGFVWIDTKERRAIAMTGGVLASKTTSASNIPSVFWKHVEGVVGAWTGDKTVDFIGADGKTASVAVP